MADWSVRQRHDQLEVHTHLQRSLPCRLLERIFGPDHDWRLQVGNNSVSRRADRGKPWKVASRVYWTAERAGRTNCGMKSAWPALPGVSSATKVITMLVTLVAVLCNSQLC